MDNIGKIFEVASTQLGIGEAPQIGREGEIERGRESEMDTGKICEVVSTGLLKGEVPQIGREGEIERGRESEMNIGKICEVVSTGLLKGEVCEAGLANIDIGKVREAAWAYYGDLTADEKKAAQKFFEDMDTDDSKTISIGEFRIFLSHANIQTNDWLFAKLDKDKNGTLDFQELVTFFYMLSRDEYKPLLYAGPSTGGTGRKEESNRSKTGSQQEAEANNGQGQKWDMGSFRRLYGKLKRAFNVVEWENDCSIV